MPQIPPTSRRVVRNGFRLGCVVSILAGSVLPLGSAHADTDPVYPSADQVTNAQASAQSAATQVSELDQQLAESRDRVDALQQAAEDVGEAANGAKIRLEAATRANTDAQAQASTAQAKADQASLILSQLAADVYQGGGDLGQLDVFFGAGGPQQVLDRAAGVEAVGTERVTMMHDAESARLLAENLHQQASETEGRRATAAAAAHLAAIKAQQAALDAATQTAQLEAQQQQMVTQLATLQNTSVQLEQQRQAGLAAEQERQREEANRLAAEAAAKAAAEQAAREAAARAAAAAAAEQAAVTARQENAAKAAADTANATATKTAAPATKKATAAAYAGTTSWSGSPVRPSPVSTQVPAPSGGVAAVIAFARAQLGKPYVWAGAGPDVWDCSGLTMMAWRQAGVDLSHYAPTQYTATAHIPIAQLQPGDLVFYGTSGETAHHVVLYIGNGMMIQAPHTGAFVDIASIYSMSDLVPYGGRPS